MGILNRRKGILFGRACRRENRSLYARELTRVPGWYGLPELPVLYNAGFGRCGPVRALLLGTMAELDCDRGEFSLLESGVK